MVDFHRYNDSEPGVAPFSAGRPPAAATFGMRLDLLPGIAQLPVSQRFHKRGLPAESLVRTALEASRVRPRFSRAPCGTRVRANGDESAVDCAFDPHSTKDKCEPLGAATFSP